MKDFSYWRETLNPMFSHCFFAADVYYLLLGLNSASALKFCVEVEDNACPNPVCTKIEPAVEVH